MSLTDSIPNAFFPNAQWDACGERICPLGWDRNRIGLNFAMTEILVVLAMITQRFRVELAMDPAKMKLDGSNVASEEWRAIRIVKR